MDATVQATRAVMRAAEVLADAVTMPARAVRSDPAIEAVGAERRAVARAYGAWLATVLRRQVLDGSSDDGAFDEHDHGWRDGRWTAFTMARLVAARSWATEIGIHAASLDEPIRRALGFICRRQNDRGELDLGGTYSANEVGFTLAGLAASYRHIVADADLGDCAAPLRRFLLRGAEAVLAGDAHTANHRWTAACAPLAAVNALWPDERFVRRIDSYLADGVDCDAEGLWYHERCPNYSDVANHGMIVMADALGRPELLDHVVRSCRLAARMVQPNGEADASFSHRQSRGATGARGPSYLVARRAAIAIGDGAIATLAKMAAQRGLPDDMLYPLPFGIDACPGPLPTEQPLPERYDAILAGGQVARRRAGRTALTVAADAGGHFFDTVRDQWGGARRSDDWFHLHHGAVVIQSLHLAVANMQAVQPASLEVRAPGRYHLEGYRDGWQHPLHFRPGRPVVDVAWGLRHSIDIEQAGDRLRLRLSATAPNALAASLRFYLRRGTVVDGCGASDLPVEPGRAIVLTGGAPLRFTNRGDAVTILGLPGARHHMSISHPEPIPSCKASSCGVVTLGLSMPVDLDLTFVLHPAPTRPAVRATHPHAKEVCHELPR